MKKLKLGILKSFCHEYKYYVKSCEELNIDYEIIDIIATNWIQQIESSNCAGFLCRPPSKYQERKSMFDERLSILSNEMGKEIYPSYNELFIYENKRMMHYWLRVNNLPHADTFVFYRKKDYYDFLKIYNNFPIIYKSNIGAKSTGVKILKNEREARRVGRKIFGIFGSPSLTKGYTPVKSGKIIPITAVGALEKHVLLVQKFEKIKWEWRIVKIGESYFGHKKLLKGDFASGGHLKGWGKPPEDLLYLIKDICERGSFNSMAVDIFETEDGRFLVNELQSIFGQPTNDLMQIDNKAGRFIFENSRFVFEEGNFNQYHSFKLRVEHFVKMLNERDKVE